MFKNLVNAGNTNVNGKLTADINLRNKDWVPSATTTGATQVPSTVRLCKECLRNHNHVDRGFFGKLGNNGVIKNLTVENVTIPTTNHYTGGLVGVLNASISTAMSGG